MKLGILDFGVVTPDSTPSETLRWTVGSAVPIERLGFSRLWFGEHHETAFSYACPETLIPAAAALTTRLHLGAAGVLLQLHSPLRVAETFRALESLYPNRIDMGLSAGLAGDDATRHSLDETFHPQIARIACRYARKVEELLMLSRNQYPSTHRFAQGPTPTGQTSPPAWLLGGGQGVGNMVLAAQFGTRFCYSLVHGNPSRGIVTVQEYRERFQPSDELESPEASIAVSVLCAETDREVLQIRARFEAWQKEAVIRIAGRPDQCKEQLLELAARYGCGEVILIPAFDRLEDHGRCYELLAEEFGLADLNLNHEAVSFP